MIFGRGGMGAGSAGDEVRTMPESSDHLILSSGHSPRANSRVEVLLTTGFCLFLNRPPPRQDKVYGDGELPPTFDARESKLVNVPRG